MEDEVDLSEANELRKSTLKLITKGRRAEGLAVVQEHVRMVQSDLSSDEVDCHSGCAYCCSLPVMVSMAEAEAVADAIRTSDRRDELIARLERDHAEIRGLTVDELAQERVPCSLLDREPGKAGRGVCAVYEARPIACRTYTSPNVEICQRAYAYPDRKVQSPSRPLDYLTQAMMQSALAGPMQKAFEMRALLLELLTSAKRKKLKPATLDVRFPPKK